MRRRKPREMEADLDMTTFINLMVVLLAFLHKRGKGLEHVHWELLGLTGLAELLLIEWLAFSGLIRVYSACRLLRTLRIRVDQCCDETRFRDEGHHDQEAEGFHAVSTC